MEIKRVSSDNAFTFSNLIWELVHIYIKCLLSYSVIKYAKSYYEKSLKKIKEINLNSFIVEILAAIFTLFYSSIIVYTFSLNNFYKIKDYVFSIWINLYRTDSNLREYDSFKMYYCKQNYYNNLSDESETSNDIKGKLTSLCLGSDSFDMFYFESLLILFLTFPHFCYLLLISFPDEENSLNSLSSIKSFLNGLVDILLKIFYSLLFMYFLYLYFSTYSNYNSILKENKKEDSSSSPNQAEKEEKENSQGFSFYEFVKVIFEIIIEIAS